MTIRNFNSGQQYFIQMGFSKPEGLDLWIAPGEARGQQFPRHPTPKGLTVNEFKILHGYSQPIRG